MLFSIKPEIKLSKTVTCNPPNQFKRKEEGLLKSLQ
jgi:hypothetical protein